MRNQIGYWPSAGLRRRSWGGSGAKLSFFEHAYPPEFLAGEDVRDRFCLEHFRRTNIMIFRNELEMGVYLESAEAYAKSGIPNWVQFGNEWMDSGRRTRVDVSSWGNTYFKLCGQPGLISLLQRLQKSGAAPDKGKGG